ncbi:predicted protein [Nematostella vectensis]|uniref:Major facilitator superfamily (MFS) profile domain-containing protein n=1 Tax=Nematostella vectensis TaxID=45351 RepID=A7RQ65_NEMVE|nr:monocarboxylate transporter 9 isoform X1 [Nematostella vectensis]XP_032219085.1 monocarboxylate transporter 9 isoform X1 [Nematostella vectensis]XP_048590027.1 monocarboxylate transporter 9 isoform X1 [Nematostella vectensis]XP_048590028.1 monocarboxylate transporter 9 isoform X1 [Nematostella vectensis]XP_048590029.1 monocarboxylate transporter 9 isoform X1 [Nematostella vectensis]EDO46439.1 predicted protein [Nematostella vectensis]|eukprot:XP_001638502.1 predicted protein [Nematostella vectensis]
MDGNDPVAVNNKDGGSIVKDPLTTYRQDGAMAWVICLLATLANLLIWGCILTFGILFPVLLDEFGYGKGTTAWVGSLALALSIGLGPVFAKLINSFGARTVTICASVVSAVGLFVTSQVNSLPLMYLTYSIPCGLGTCGVFLSSFDIIAKYFSKRLSLATAIAHSGSVVSLLVMSPLIEASLSSLGWRYTFMVLGGMSLAIPIFGAFYFSNDNKEGNSTSSQAPSKEEDAGAENKLPNNDVTTKCNNKSHEDEDSWTDLLRNRKLLACCATGFVMDFGGTIPLLHLGRYSQDVGIPSQRSALLYVGFGVGSTVGRVLIGRLCDLPWVSPLYMYCLSTMVAGVSTLLVPQLDSFAGLIGYFTVNGFANGGYATAVFMIVYQMTIPRMRTKALGLYFFVVSLAFASGSPFGGFLADSLGSYIVVFYVSGGLVVFSSFAMLSIKCLGTQEVVTTHGETCDTIVQIENIDVKEEHSSGIPAIADQANAVTTVF